MTPLNKPVVRLSATEIRDGGKRRKLVVTLHGEFLELRLHGTRRSEIVNLEAAYFGAIKARVFSERMEKAKARAKKREDNKPRGRR